MREPNHYDEVKKAGVLALEQKKAQEETLRKAEAQALEQKKAQEEALRKAQEADLEKRRAEYAARQEEIRRESEQLKTPDGVEAHMAAFEKGLDERVKTGGITAGQKTYLLARENNRVAMLINKDIATSREVSKPEIDPERMVIDRVYRREVEQQFKQEQKRLLQRSNGLEL
jgi:hypothetical protein